MGPSAQLPQVQAITIFQEEELPREESTNAPQDSHIEKEMYPLDQEITPQNLLIKDQEESFIVR